MRIFQAERNISRVLRASIVASDHLHLRHKQKLHQLRQTAASSIQSSLGRLSEHLARQELPSACRPQQREVPELSAQQVARFVPERTSSSSLFAKSGPSPKENVSKCCHSIAKRVLSDLKAVNGARTSNHRGSMVFSARHFQTQKADRPMSLRVMSDRLTVISMSPLTPR